MRLLFMRIVFTVLFLTTTVSFAQQGTNRQFVHSSIRDLVNKMALTPKGSMDSTSQLRLAITLPLRNLVQLHNLLRQLYDPTSPMYHRYLTVSQFTDQFGPSEADYHSLIAFVSAHGLTVTHVTPNRMILDVTGSVGKIERSFHVRILKYRDHLRHRDFYAPDSEPSINLRVPVLGIAGLTDYYLTRPSGAVVSNSSPTTSSSGPGSGPNGEYEGYDFRSAYAHGVSLTGSGQSVGLVEFDGYDTSDITYYEENVTPKLPHVNLKNVLVDEASGTTMGVALDQEVCEDIEMAISMAPGLKQVVVYEAPYDSGSSESTWDNLLNRMATDDIANQLSCSWWIINGKANSGAEQIFQEMATQGQSFFEASGDSDAYTGLIPFPADSPDITQVGGTTLQTAGPDSTYVSETVWSGDYYSGIGSGGGISTHYAIPYYQLYVHMSSDDSASTTMRNTPDVAMAADNVYVRCDNQSFLGIGTSLAAPLWAGFTALVNEQAAQKGRGPVGFINPAIYYIASTPAYASDFNDIQSGGNYWVNSPLKFFAGPGYDLCSGLGSPNGQNLINALTSTVWSGDVVLSQNWTVPSGTELTILPGTTVQIASGASITCDGTLNAVGTQSNPIVFKEATSGSHWDLIQLNSNNNSFSDCVFDGGTYDMDVEAGQSNSFQDCTFENAIRGFQLNNASCSIDGCTFTNNQDGIILFYGGDASVVQSTISNNSGVGLEMWGTDVTDFANNLVENNGSYGIDIEGQTFWMGNGDASYPISSPNITTPTTGAGENEITGNNTSSGGAQIYLDTGGRLYVGDLTDGSSGYSLAEGFNSITTGTYYIYNAAMTVIDETEEQWTVPAEETYWGGHGVGSENFYGTVDFSYPLTSDPSGAAGASALEVVTTPGTGRKPATLMTATMAANVFKSAPDASQGQFFVNLKNRMMQVINDINNPKMALTHPRMIGYLNSLCSFDTNDVTGERGAVQDLLTSYYKELPAGNFSDTTSRLCSEAALVAEVQNEVNSGQLDSAETLMNEYGKYVKNNDNQRTLLFNQMEIDQQRKQDGEALGVLKQIEAFKPDSRQKKGYEAPDYSVIASVLSPGAGSSSQSQSKEVSSAQTQQLPKTFELLQNYPNPFNPTTTIDYQLPAASNVTLIVYDVTGQEVAVLESGHQGAGSHQAIFNGSRFASGVYFVRLVAQGQNGRQYIKTVKMLELK